jgi:hypothetical protein
MTDHVARPERASALWAAGFVVAVLLGVALRLIWGDDIEYKGDERWTFERALEIGRSAEWPWVGMPTSVVLPHPGMSIWVFVALARIFAVETPPELARAVQTCNIAAILALIAFVLRAVPRPDREPWMWSVALYSVNPLAVIFDRKIWPPTIVPLAVVAMIAGWWHRGRAWGALLWGAAGAIIGQLHTGGLIFAFALFFWTALFDRRSVAWRWWFAGSAAAAWPLIPWFLELLERRAGADVPPTLGARLPMFTFYTRWLTEPWGLGAEYTLGRTHFLDFISWPLIAGRPTYLLAAVHVALIAIAIAIAVRAIARARQVRPRPADLFVGRDRPALFLSNTMLWAYGGILSLSTLSVHRHYMIAIHVVKFLWITGLAFYGALARSDGLRTARMLLLALCVGQALVSVGLLSYIHAKQVIVGEYGPTWRSQQPGAAR